MELANEALVAVQLPEASQRKGYARVVGPSGATRAGSGLTGQHLRCVAEHSMDAYLEAVDVHGFWAGVGEAEVGHCSLLLVGWS